MNSDIQITCTSLDCPERTGGVCNATVDPNLMVELFLEESNKIEGVYDADSLKQAKYAWDYLITEEKLTGGVILKLHKILMLHQPLRPNERGYWRQIQVGVYKGGTLVREGPPWRQVPELIQSWLKDAATSIRVPGKNGENIRLDHITYEHIHPFVDGNGRTGRMLMNWQRLKAGLPLLIIFDDDKQEYYKWF